MNSLDNHLCNSRDRSAQRQGLAKSHPEAPSFVLAGRLSAGCDIWWPTVGQRLGSILQTR